MGLGYRSSIVAIVMLVLTMLNDGFEFLLTMSLHLGFTDMLNPAVGIYGYSLLSTLVLLLMSAIAWLYWFHKLYATVGRSQPMSTTPGMAVGYWFIPIMSLWKPYQLVAEVWRKSRGEHDPIGSEPTWWVIKVWWALWLLSSGFAQISVRSVSYLPATIQSLISLIGAVMAIRIVIQLDRQVSKSKLQEPSTF